MLLPQHFLAVACKQVFVCLCFDASKTMHGRNCARHSREQDKQTKVDVCQQSRQGPPKAAAWRAFHLCQSFEALFLVLPVYVTSQLQHKVGQAVKVRAVAFDQLGQSGQMPFSINLDAKALLQQYSLVLQKLLDEWSNFLFAAVHVLHDTQCVSRHVCQCLPTCALPLPMLLNPSITLHRSQTLTMQIAEAP